MDDQYQAIRKEIVARLWKRFWLAVDYVLFFIVLFRMWLNPENLYRLSLFSILWIGVLIVHTLYVFGFHKRWERLLDRRVRREMARRGITEESLLTEKPKRESMVRLSSDGELLDVPAEKTKTWAHRALKPGVSRLS